VFDFNPSGNEIEWVRLRDFLRLAQKAASSYNPSRDDLDDKQNISRQTIELFIRFLTSRTGLFLKKPLVHELAEAIDGKLKLTVMLLMASKNTDSYMTML
jgi:hypothetical protein